ncbi:MAG: hypothetical protein GEU80_03075 [Dehalococcoidia bacterium]|nr:hypothetical protein [Dehalococcoidia bacterium]
MPQERDDPFQDLRGRQYVADILNALARYMEQGGRLDVFAIEPLPDEPARTRVSFAVESERFDPLITDLMRPDR